MKRTEHVPGWRKAVHATSQGPPPEVQSQPSIQSSSKLCEAVLLCAMQCVQLTAARPHKPDQALTEAVVVALEDWGQIC